MDSQNFKNINDKLSHFSGTEKYYKHPYGFKYTDGVQYLASTFQCYWLLAYIKYLNIEKLKVRQTLFQVWKLKRIIDKKEITDRFILSCEDGNYNQVLKIEIPYSDIAGDEVSIWFIDNIMLLPSEY